MFTIGGWVVLVLVAAAALGIAWFAYSEDSNPRVCFGIAITVIAVTFGSLYFYYNKTASGQRAFKSQESEFNNGIERVVTVYDVDGDIIAQYEGKFDITYDDNRILFDDENDKRHIIYYSISTVTIDER